MLKSESNFVKKTDSTVFKDVFTMITEAGSCKNFKGVNVTNSEQG